MAVSKKRYSGKRLCTFWDEPEANINPLYISIIVDMLLELQRKEVQIFIATHDYMLASYFEVRKRKGMIYYIIPCHLTKKICCLNMRNPTDFQT